MLTRREFVSAGAAGAAALLTRSQTTAEEKPAAIAQRPLGKTSVNVPILGLGTVALGALSDQNAALKLLNRAIDLGVTYIDTAPPRTRIAAFTGYGNAHKYINAVLKERRKEVFIVTKCLETDGTKTLDLVRSNLKELGLEQVDLIYTHSIGHANYDFDALVADTGPMAALEKIKKDGLCKFVGITGHNRPEKFAQVIQKREIDVMMNAVNIVDRHTYAFEELVWPIARKKKIGLVAMKVFGGGVATCKMPEKLREASLRYCLSISDMATAVIGMRTVEELEQNVAWVRRFKPMTKDEAQELKKETVELAKQWKAHLDLLDPKGEKNRPLINT